MRNPTKSEFTEWLKKRDITLLPWQQQAAEEFVSRFEKNQQMASGKTFLLEVVYSFLGDHEETPAATKAKLGLR